MWRRVFGTAIVGALCVITPAAEQTVNPCDADATGPFVVTSARSFTITWCTATMRTAADGSTVPERIDGFYLFLDATKTDIDMATFIGLSTITNRNAWSYSVPSGISRGSHTAGTSAWNYILNEFGQPTTERAESAATLVPFTAVDPTLTGPPLAPTGVRIVR